MSKYLEVINKCVDSDGYSSSPGFIGFFERDEPFSEKLCNEAINLLFRACDPRINHYILVCNLFVVGDDTSLREAYDLTDKSFHDFIHPLIVSGVVHRKSCIDDSDWEMNADTTSVLEDVAVELLRKTFFGIIGVGGIRGHCFAILPDLGLIIYPHDDTGFGFICMEKDGTRYEQLCNFVRDNFNSKGFALTLWRDKKGPTTPGSTTPPGG